MLIPRIYTSYGKVLPDEIKAALKTMVDNTLDRYGEITVFFRADDIGPPSKNYTRMMELFVTYQMPLCLAVVPVWMTQRRWESMAGFAKQNPGLFCWHMHGYMHKNYEIEGKKQEFGPSRSKTALLNDLSKGQTRLENILADDFTPVFTPPWNRCSSEAMDQLKDLGFKGISRSTGSKPLPPNGFTDIPVHVDLHTRKEKEAGIGWQNLLEEFKTHLPVSPCGIMLHHMRMNDAAFIFLEYLLALFAGHNKIKTVTYRDLM